MHSGPLPTPDDLRQYEQVYPGAAKRIFDRWEKQSEHRMAVERRMVASNVSARTRGQYIGFAVALTVIIGGFTAIFLDKSLVGLAALVLAAGAIAGRFLMSRRANGSETTPANDQPSRKVGDSRS